MRLTEVISVWLSIGNDGLGGDTWSDPITYPARIAYRQEKFTDKNGDTQMSTAVCYSEGVTLELDAMVLLDVTSTAPVPPDEANDVRALSFTPSGSGPLKTAWFA